MPYQDFYIKYCYVLIVIAISLIRRYLRSFLAPIDQMHLYHARIFMLYDM